MNKEIPINIQKKPKVEKVEKLMLNTPESVYNLKEVQAIKYAIQEHLIFIGLNGSNNIRDILFIGISTSSKIQVDTKDILRTALLNACDRVILVHNHPSNNLTPSNQDKYLTDKTNKVLDIFNIKLLDHLIVTEESYTSMAREGYIDRGFRDSDTCMIDNTLLIEENKILKEKIKDLQKKKSKNNELER